MGSVLSMEAQGKSAKNNSARDIKVSNDTDKLQPGLVLTIKTSQFFYVASVDLELAAKQSKVIPLPHRVREGCELKGEETVTYALLQRNNNKVVELGTISATVRMIDHTLFTIETPVSEPVDFSKPFFFEITIRNDSSGALPPNTKVSIFGTTCFQPASVIVGEVAAGGSKTVRLEHRVVEGKVSLENIEEVTTYALTHEGLVLALRSRRATMSEYSKYLLRYAPKDGGQLRILLCGGFGLGKTAFIRAVRTALSPGHLVATGYGAVSPLGGHGTSALKIYACHEDALPFAFLVDTWGKSESNYSKNELFAILEGVMKEGSHMDNPEMEEKASNDVHSVIMFVSAANQSLHCEKDLLKKTFEKRQNPTIGVSMCDSQLKDGEITSFRTNPNEPIDVLEAKKAYFASELGTGAVLQVASYVANETSKSFERDRLTLRILEHALNAAKNYYEQVHPKQP